MAREQRLLDTFVELADTLVDDYDMIDFLQVLTERCVALLDTSEAGVMIIPAGDAFATSEGSVHWLVAGLRMWPVPIRRFTSDGEI